MSVIATSLDTAIDMICKAENCPKSAIALKSINPIESKGRYSNYELADRKTIENIVSVSEWNKDCHPGNVIKVKYGYVMPLYHGYQWKATKAELIRIYTFGPKR